MVIIQEKDRQRLQSARNLWLATVRPSHTPHLVPIWFVWLEGRAYICTSNDSVKARNIARNPRVAFALEDGDDPVVIEGSAVMLEEIPAGVAEAFEEKFGWNIRGDGTYNVVIEITPTRLVL